MFRIVVLEKTLESPLDCKEVKPVNPKGRQPWISIGRTVAEAPILWPPDLKSWLIGKDSDAGKDWRQKERAWQRMRWSDSITNSMDVNLSKLGHIVKDRGAWRATVPGVTKSPTQLWLNNYHLSPVILPVPSPTTWKVPAAAFSLAPCFLLPATAQHILLKCKLRCSHPLPEQCNSSGKSGRSVDANRVLMFSGSPWMDRRGCQAVRPWNSGVCVSPSVVPNSLRPHGLEPTWILCPWDSPGKNIGVGYHSLLQGISPTQRSNPGLPHCRQILYCLSYLGSPRIKGRGWEGGWVGPLTPTSTRAAPLPAVYMQ